MKTVAAGFAVVLVLSGAMAADTPGGSGELQRQMTKSASEMKSMKMTGDVDHDFVAAMRKHHQDGIAMAKIALQHGNDAKAREFAQKVVDEQTRDLQQFEAWLAQHQPASSSGDTRQGRRPATDVKGHGHR